MASTTNSSGINPVVFWIASIRTCKPCGICIDTRLLFVFFIFDDTVLIDLPTFSTIMKCRAKNYDIFFALRKMKYKIFDPFIASCYAMFIGKQNNKWTKNGRRFFSYCQVTVCSGTQRHHNTSSLLVGFHYRIQSHRPKGHDLHS